MASLTDFFKSAKFLIVNALFSIIQYRHNCVRISENTHISTLSEKRQNRILTIKIAWNDETYDPECLNSSNIPECLNRRMYQPNDEMVNWTNFNIRRNVGISGNA